MSLRTKFYTLWKGCFDNSFNGVLFLHPLFVQNWVRISHHSYAVQARSQGLLIRLLIMEYDYRFGISAPTCHAFSRCSAYNIHMFFNACLCRNKHRHWNQKNKAPRRMIFTHHLPEALQNVLQCAILSTRKRSHKSVKMLLSSFGRMPGGCSNNRLCYGSIFYF